MKTDASYTARTHRRNAWVTKLVHHGPAFYYIIPRAWRENLSLQSFSKADTLRATSFNPQKQKNQAGIEGEAVRSLQIHG